MQYKVCPITKFLVELQTPSNLAVDSEPPTPRRLTVLESRLLVQPDEVVELLSELSAAEEGAQAGVYVDTPAALAAGRRVLKQRGQEIREDELNEDIVGKVVEAASDTMHSLH